MTGSDLNPPELAEAINAKGFMGAAGFRIVKDIIMQQRGGMDQFDGGCNIDNVLGPFSAQSQVSQDCHHRPYSFPAAIDQVRRDIGQALFPRSNRARESPFHELKLSSDGLKWIAPVETQRNLPPRFRRQCGLGSYCFDFCFVNQIGSGPPQKS